MKPDKARAHYMQMLATGRRLIVAAEKGLRDTARAAAKAAPVAQKPRTGNQSALAPPTGDTGAVGLM